MVVIESCRQSFLALQQNSLAVMADGTPKVYHKTLVEPIAAKLQSHVTGNAPEKMQPTGTQDKIQQPPVTRQFGEKIAQGCE
jgi:hypothetical protein